MCVAEGLRARVRVRACTSSDAPGGEGAPIGRAFPERGRDVGARHGRAHPDARALHDPIVRRYLPIGSMEMARLRICLSARVAIDWIPRSLGLSGCIHVSTDLFSRAYASFLFIAPCLSTPIARRRY